MPDWIIVIAIALVFYAIGWVDGCLANSARLSGKMSLPPGKQSVPPPARPRR